MPPAEFGPAIPADERPQTQALDREAARIGILITWYRKPFYLQGHFKGSNKHYVGKCTFIKD
jgi:hypothetical protein